MSTGEKGWLSWIKDDHVLEWAKLEQDVQKLNDFYYNHGYMSARVGKPEINRTKDGLLLTINIEEGPRFKVIQRGHLRPANRSAKRAGRHDQDQARQLV